ncbi:hypothetical protein BG015_000162 [Linnemannia schmuckeri]|uniref:ditrans,polycis-polyprenyl diphosphate synthase [(2E,6E)-farnesyldiphosphate specific] n=1 Tax=Linnemannia schmuckeri TaxID=64567 RepID=A0A9P5VEB6_9FUNG|nr:hypothetical protein BG015_000162 [Linnemannia schmuckeri]
MPAPSPATTLRRRGASPSRDTLSTNELASRQHKEQQPLKTSRTAADLIADHPAIKPIIPASQGTSSSLSTQAGHSTEEISGTSFTRTATTTTATSSPSIASRIIHILLKPFYFLLFALLHLGHELVISTRTMKTLVQVFFLPHLFPVAPELVRIVRKDVGPDLVKKPTHLAVITQKSGITLTGEVDETEEDEWHARVAQLAQWSSAVGIKTLSIMRNTPLHPEDLEALQDRIDHTMKDFYKEEKRVPIALVRTLRPVEESLSLVFQQQNNGQTTIQRDLRLHGGRVFDLDIVILSPEDGHDRLAGNVRLLGKAALRQQISSEQITTTFLDTQLSADLSEPELLIILKDDLDLSSYPPWHIRLTEIYHHPDQAVIPAYTMFLQALHRYAKCEQRFGK